MIECSGKGDYLLISLLTPLRQGLFHPGGIDMHKFMPTGAHGVSISNGKEKWHTCDIIPPICTRGAPKNSGNGWSKTIGYG